MQPVTKLCYCDQDDVWLPEKLTVLQEELERTSALLVCSDMVIIDSGIGLFLQALQLLLQPVHPWLIYRHEDGNQRLTSFRTSAHSIGGHNEMRNIDIVKRILSFLGKPESLITYVAVYRQGLVRQCIGDHQRDQLLRELVGAVVVGTPGDGDNRKGHDMRYAIDPSFIHRELGWLPETRFEDGIQKTVAVVLHIQPVTHIEPLSVYRQGLVRQCIGDHQREGRNPEDGPVVPGQPGLVGEYRQRGVPELL